MNERHLRAAFPIPDEPLTLNAKIDRALAELDAPRPIGRRLALGFALTAALAVALVAVPARRAEASFGAILGALESSAHVRMTQYAVDENGRPAPYRTIDASGPNAHTYRRDGSEDRYDIGAQSLAYDPLLKAFVVTPRDARLASRTKIRFVPGREVSNGLETNVVRTTENGMEILRATETPRGGRHRFVIDASVETKRPFAWHHDLAENGRWHTVETMTFDYRAPFTVSLPTKAPHIDDAEADRRSARILSDHTLGQVALKTGRIVVRRVDVAADGTVYVAFQRGARPDPWFEGYTFRLTDSLGTDYVRVGQPLKRSFDKAPSPDGPFEMETFVPSVKTEGWRPRTLRLQAHRFADHRWAGTLDRTRFLPDGRPEPWPGILLSSAEDKDPTPVDLPGLAFDRPTCEVVPAWARLFDPMTFGDAFNASLAKIEAQAKWAMDARRYADAVAFYDEEVAVIREGAHPASLDKVREDRAKAQAMLKP